MKNFKKLIKESYLGNPLNEVVRGDDFRFIEIKDLHFETDPDRLEDMKIEFGEKMGGFTTKDKIEDAEYELRRFRKEIGYGDGTSADPFLPGTYDAVTSKLGDGPHAKKVSTPKWNERKYEQWIKDVASGGGAEFAYDMAQNAKMEAGLIDWVKKNRLGFGDVTPLERIQYDIEALAESVNEESEGDKDYALPGSKADKKFSDMNEGRSMARFSYADKGSPIKVGDTLYKDGKAGKVIQKLEDRDKLNVEFDDGSIIGVNYTSVEGDKIVREISTTPVSGTKAGVIYSLDNRKYVLTSDVKGARIGDYTNITLPKGTVIYNLPGGLMADHESLRQYAKLSGNIYFDKPTYAGVGIRRMPDILTAIENNSNVIEESLNEEEMLFMDRIYKDAAETSINLDDFKRTIKATYGKYAEDDDTLEAAYEKFRVTRPNLEEDEDLDINYSDASAGDKSIEDESASGAYESKGFDFKKMVKEALIPNNLK